jgi:hypothetical protein
VDLSKSLSGFNLSRIRMTRFGSICSFQLVCCVIRSVSVGLIVCVVCLCLCLCLCLCVCASVCLSVSLSLSLQWRYVWWHLWA